MDTENPTTAPRVPSYLPPPIYRTAPVPGEVVEMSSLLGEACARWPTTTISPHSDGDVGLLSDYSMICHVVARPDRVDEDLQTVGLMGVGFGVLFAVMVVVLWRFVGFLCRHRSDISAAKARKEADAAAVMQWSAQTVASRLRTAEGLRRGDSPCRSEES
jgi:hypothetical protein